MKEEFKKTAEEKEQLKKLKKEYKLKQISCRDNPRIDRDMLLKFFKAGNDCGCMEHENIEDYFEQYFRI